MPDFLTQPMSPTAVLVTLIVSIGIPTFLVIWWIRRAEPIQPIDKDAYTVSPEMMSAFEQSVGSGRNLFNPKDDLHTEYWGPGGVRDRMLERMKDEPWGWPQEPK